jgi:hypothetical protein
MPVLLLLTEKERQLADGRGAGGGKGRRRSQIMRRREGLVLYNKLKLSGYHHPSLALSFSSLYAAGRCFAYIS